MINVLQLMPYLEGEEMIYVQGIIKDMSENQASLFANVYGSRRKDSTTILLTACVGFLGISGIHRFILGHVGMGILFLLTAGLCFIGTIVDIVNYKKLTIEYNQKVAQEVAVITRGSVQ